MDRNLSQYLHTKRIDHFQKLNLLLFLYQHPQLKGTSEEFAKWLYIGDAVLLKKIIVDLQYVGLVERIGIRYKLRNEPWITSHLKHLAGTYEDPLTRQELLDQVLEQAHYRTETM